MSAEGWGGDATRCNVDWEGGMLNRGYHDLPL